MIPRLRRLVHSLWKLSAAAPQGLRGRATGTHKGADGTDRQGEIGARGVG
jgi:hypothetical protein